MSDRLNDDGFGGELKKMSVGEYRVVFSVQTFTLWKNVGRAYARIAF